jgi:hypothetical protein
MKESINVENRILGKIEDYATASYTCRSCKEQAAAAEVLDFQ